jgi:hypothetical protein
MMLPLATKIEHIIIINKGNNGLTNIYRRLFD